MSKVFSYDSPVWRFMGRVADCFMLTLLWVLTSLPVFTIGVSTTTVYYVALKMAEDQEEYLIPMYFKTFRKLFKEALWKSFLLLLIGLCLVGDIVICYIYSSPMTTVLMSAFVVISLLYMMIVTYFFPVMARTNNTIAGFLKASFYLAIRYISWTILLLVIPLCIIIVGIFVFWPLLLFSVGMIAYLQSLIFRQIFRQQGWSEA